LANLAFLAVQLLSIVWSMSRTEQERGREELVDGVSRRLVALRKRAGMTQQGVADAMGKSRAGVRLARRLERGAIDSASLATLVEYLRAVRAGFGDLKEVLDRYTSLPIPEPVRKRAEAAPPPRLQTSVRTWGNGDSPKGTRPRSDAGNASRMCPRRADARYSPRFPDEELAVLRVRRRAGYWALRRLFEFYLHSVLNSVSIPPYTRIRRIMAAYARRVFNALYRTHGATDAKRVERLARLRASAEKRALDPALAECAEAIAELAYNEMREHDELDWMPPVAEARAVMAVKPKHRVVTDFQMCLAKWADVSSRYNAALMAIYERPHKAALDLVESARCDARTLIRYRGAALRAANIARTTVPDTPRRRKSIDDWQATDWPREMDCRLLERMLAAALATWDALLPTLPPAPGPRPV
jgi:transcriptional regulator with XRE-family HTH domain